MTTCAFSSVYQVAGQVLLAIVPGDQEVRLSRNHPTGISASSQECPKTEPQISCSSSATKEFLPP